MTSTTTTAEMECTISQVASIPNLFQSFYTVFDGVSLFFVKRKEHKILYEYNTITTEHTKHHAPFEMPDDMQSMALAGSKIYICTGAIYTNNYNYTSDVYSFNKISKKFKCHKTGSNGPSPRVRSSLAARYDVENHQSNIILYGGYDKVDWKSDMFLYGTFTKTWKEVKYTQAKVPGKRLNFGFYYCPKTDRFFIHGGYNGSNNINDFWFYSFATGYWTEIDNTITGPITYHRMMPVHDSLFIIIKNGGSSLELYGYDLAHNSKVTITPKNTSLIQSMVLQEFAIANINDRELLFFATDSKSCLFKLQFPENKVPLFCKKKIAAFFDVQVHLQW